MYGFIALLRSPIWRRTLLHMAMVYSKLISMTLPSLSLPISPAIRAGRQAGRHSHVPIHSKQRYIYVYMDEWLLLIMGIRFIIWSGSCKKLTRIALVIDRLLWSAKSACDSYHREEHYGVRDNRYLKSSYYLVGHMNLIGQHVRF